MNKQLIFIFIFIIIVPIGAINFVGYNLIKCDGDNVECIYKDFFLDNNISELDHIDNSKNELVSSNHLKYVYLIKILTFYFLFIGGYFLISQLRAIGSATQKVSFINQVSHELKTPLTNLRLYIDLLKNSLNDDAPSLEKLDVLERESRRLEQLVNNVLLFSYGKRIKLSKQTEDIDKLIAQIADSFRPLFEQKNIALQLDCKAGSARVDRSVLEQVLVNLLGNVEKYAADGKFINIKARQKDNQVSITVQDDGMGIPDEMKETIFKPFERGDNSLIEGASGIGIGLTLCVNLMEAHGGTLKLNKSDKGTCFEVVF